MDTLILVNIILINTKCLFIFFMTSTPPSHLAPTFIPGLTWLLVYRTEKYQRLKTDVERQCKKSELEYNRFIYLVLCYQVTEHNHNNYVCCYSMLYKYYKVTEYSHNNMFL